MPLLSLFFPRRCVSCGKIGRYFCKKCSRNISFINYLFCPVCRHPSMDGTTHARCRNRFSLDGLFVSANYRGPVKKALRLMKYQYVSDLTSELTDLLFTSAPSFLKNLDFLIPVPLHPKREKDRGFNQSFLIAKLLGKKLNIPVRKNLLQRIKATKPQFGLKVGERNLNIRGAFNLINPEVVRHKKIGLVDDVATTFFTLKECAKELKIAQAKSVWAIVLAHGN
ncbi:hypothetical protein A2W14_05790 [Candidatus Gottesmanbacteria bacterium RBG_16_37_8]|uniref:Double zinc ribbon domain-containing protein n=1 Tax=Candidatus Gottesmanbacteria bacterium RBG_16_37_8 TaxID=1798371 RepID=A0A1F5YUV7_9BACT|nr:MAG: hypothetical protein A2W14_05790 [Candidatus Gottesmanbacteria bacterium RBG_16_37_8]